MAIVIGIIVAIVVTVLLFKPFFGDKEEFMRCVKFWLTPNIVSLFRGEYTEDWKAEMKLGLWLGAGALAGFAASYVLMKLMG